MKNFTRPITEIIRERSSRRKYDGRAIDEGKRKKIDKILSSRPPVPFESETRFGLIAAAPGDRDALKGLGTYGFIRDAPGFIVGAIKSSPNDLEDYGYAMEHHILAATDLGLGTCWLGGTFSRSSFAERISMRADETVPAVAAIGEFEERRGAVEQVIRWSVKAKKRKPWTDLFFDGSFDVPLSESKAGELATAFEMVRLGPSASNKQPWRLVLSSRDRVEFYVHREAGGRASYSALGFADLKRVDAGIAICHFDLATREQGIEGRWSLDDPGLSPLPAGREYIATWQRTG